MTKGEYHRKQAWRAGLEANALLGKAATAELTGSVELASVLRTAAAQRQLAAINHQRALKKSFSFATN